MVRRRRQCDKLFFLCLLFGCGLGFCGDLGFFRRLRYGSRLRTFRFRDLCLFGLLGQFGGDASLLSGLRLFRSPRLLSGFGTLDSKPRLLFLRSPGLVRCFNPRGFRGELVTLRLGERRIKT